MKYRCITGVHRSKEYPVAASQQFNLSGGAFVVLDANGNIRLALTADATIFGYAVVPTRSATGSVTGSVWTSSATAGQSRIPVIRITADQEFLVPANATVTAAMRGNACDLIGANDGTAQQANVGISVTDVLLIQEVGNDKTLGELVTDVLVRVNPAKIQADT